MILDPTARRMLSSLAILFALCCAPRSAGAADPEPRLAKRPEWTTSRVIGSPEPPFPYVSERAFPALSFKNCIDLVAFPGNDRLVVIEQGGKILSFPNRSDVAQADPMIDLAQAIPGVKETYALAFHPDFARNRYCYVCYIKSPNDPDGTHIARFRVADADPPTIDVASETTIITWLSGGHNGCCLKFGPDGCLYISTGDATAPSPPDALKTGQDLSDLLSCILRIDVDRADEGRNYRIPRDNPFVDLSGVRGEIWAYGLRNPWRMSFDRQSGDLWVGDVGWEMWEMLYRVERGGNYGWAVTEGRQSINPEWPRGPTPILPPTIDHSHHESSSITDGLTYYGKRLPELSGMHLYGDYDTGKIWGFRFEKGKVVDHRELADTTLRIVGFGETRDGECLIVDHIGGAIHRLVPNPQRNHAGAFPRALSDTGLFSSAASQAPSQGVIPYSINAEPWSDHAVSERWVALPGDSSIQRQGPVWTFPKNAVLAKTLSLEMRRGDATSRRRVETQLLHFDGADWMPYSYRWNDAQTDAALVDAKGADQQFEIVAPNEQGGKQRVNWRFSGRGECQRCHNKWSGPVLGFNTRQLNKDHSYGEAIVNQLEALAQLGVLDRAPKAEALPRLASPRDASADLDQRARAYLHVNCAHCHRLNAGGSVMALMHDDVPLANANLVDVRPSQGTFGIHGARILAPGDPCRSVLLYRIAKLGSGRMPHVGSMEVDRDGVALIHDWIAKLPQAPSQPPGADGGPNIDRPDELVELASLRNQAKSTEDLACVDRLLATTRGALALLWSIDRRELSDATTKVVVSRAAAHGDVNVRDLFERFLPLDERVKRLGNTVVPTQVLRLAGDAERGKQLVLNTAGVNCKTCHRIHEHGAEVGPDLTSIGKARTREQLLESILEPSKQIDPKYVTYLAETNDGRLLTGVLVRKDEQVVMLKDAQGKSITIPSSQIEQLAPQRQSLMPELLVRDLTAQQVADLLAYLGSLK